MFCQGTVTGLAIDLRMLAILLLIHDICVTGLASLVSCKVDRTRGDLSYGISPIVSIFTKAFRDEESTDP